MDIKGNCLNAVEDVKGCIRNPYIWRTSFSMKNSVYKKNSPGKDTWSSSFSKSCSVSLTVMAGIFAAVMLITCIALKIKKTVSSKMPQE